MKKKRNKISAEQPHEVYPPFLIHDLTIVSPDRSRKDIGSLRDAIVSAEQVYFPNRALLYDLYHDIYTMDGYLSGIIDKRIDFVLNKKLKFYDKDGKDVEEISNLMQGETGRDLIRKIMESVFWGISGVEFKIGGEFAFDEIPRKHIKPEKGLITKSQYGISADAGYRIDELPFVWVIGKKDDLGKLLACSMYAIYKRGNFGDWAQYVEIFGQPVRILEYDAYDTKTKQELKGMLDKAGNSLAMMIPKQAKFQMLDGKQSNGDGKLQLSFKDACNEEMAIRILGNTQTTSSTRGSGYAQAKEHGEQQEQITASDLTMVENYLNSDHFLNILRSYGYNIEGGYFGYEKELDPERLKQRLEIDLQVSEKVPIADDYWYDTYGLPKPDNYDELRKKMDEKANFNPMPPEKQPGEKEEKKDKETENLSDFSKSKFLDPFFKKLADFFDHARL
ncbi:hypothetical protein OK18_19155 [Chryseobacterium gallinarum]|uniref:DUF935 family protein n=1 Tax=Chryseobacterium gallinarum TaxID=1324352 RepID=A0A0G3M5K1_CHRGL|nr:DUF935 family protein [Chryseobacterium gallinarum]AKK74451.1 hypothetical protein OK18_19155 [Chryseobacterium gallinarum]